MRMPKPLVLNHLADEMWLYFGGYDEEESHQWAIDALELGRIVAEALTWEARRGAAEQYAFEVKMWDLDRWLESPEGEAALASAAAQLIDGEVAE